MATAKCLVVLDKLIKSGDFNVRLTVLKSGGSLKEGIRDSLGGGIIHSSEEFSVECKSVSYTGQGKELSTFQHVMGCTVKGCDIVDHILNEQCSTLGVRITIDKRTWIIVVS